VSSFDPNFRVLIDGVQYTGLIDWNISITNGQATPFTFPTPGSMNLSLIFLETPAVPINLRSKVDLQWYDPVVPYWAAVYTGWVTDYSLSFQSFGVAGKVTILNIQTIGPLAFLNGQEYYLDADTTDTTKNTVTALINAVNTTTWEEVNPSSSWSDLQPTVTWAAFDKTLTGVVNVGISGSSGPNVTRSAGYRQVLTDLQALFNGSHSLCREDNNGAISWVIDPTSLPITITPDMVNMEYTAGVSISDVRNLVDVSNPSGVLERYGDDYSRQLYGTVQGSIDTLLTNTGDAVNAAAYIVKGSSIPTLSRRQVIIDMYNPNLTDANRDDLLPSLIGAIFDTSALSYPGDTGEFQVWERNVQISRDSVLFTFSGGSVSWFNGTPTWLQISPAYTWTSYGTAFPTQKWSDL
jgi:hypothetical protein